MHAPNPDYRENPARSVYIAGRINQELLNRLTPTINRLRLESVAPITVYIDSEGGSVPVATTIRSLIKAPTQDGNSCRLITVVTGTAASAAADFLALGDYAIAYSHAEIYHHGPRTVLEEDEALTHEFAKSLAAGLAQRKEFFALRLARCAFPRFVVRLSQFTAEFKDYSTNKDSDKLLLALVDKLTQPNRLIVLSAMEKRWLIRRLTRSVGD